MKYSHRDSDRLSKRLFVKLKYFLSVLSVVFTSAFVLVLEMRV